MNTSSPVPFTNISSQFTHLEALLHTQIRKIHQPFSHCITMEVYGHEESQKWLFSSHPHYPRVCQTWQYLKNPHLPPVFCLWLRKKILDAKISEIHQLDEHIIEFSFLRKGKQYFLIWEANGRDSNLILLDSQHQLLTALKNPNQLGRELKQGNHYTLPTNWKKNIIPENIPSDLKALDRYIWGLEIEGDIVTNRSQYQKHFKTLNKKLKRRLEKQEQDLLNCQQESQYQKWGELIKSQLNQIEMGQTEITVTDYYDPNLAEIVILLDPQKSPNENLGYFFQKSEKLKKAMPHIEERTLKTIEEQEQLNLFSNQLLSLQSSEDFITWEKTLPRFLRLQSPKKMASPKNQEPVTELMTRFSSDHLMIVVGRNKTQNAQVTFSVAKGNDWWFHAQGVSGSHVIVKSSQPLPQQTILEAAQLAAYYCKVRSERKIEVDYTQRKYVRKIKGGEPGQVTYSQTKSILVELDDQLIRRLLESEL